MAKQGLPNIHAGSMADIAFLLLIFFLVTTTIDKDKGIFRKLPDKSNIDHIPIHKRNILEITINAQNEIMVEDDILPLELLTQEAIAFIDNGGFPIQGDTKYCEYCQGNRDPLSSDHPHKAVIAITTHREALYETYITVQDQIARAYNSLRNRESQRLYGFDFTIVKQSLQDGSYKGDKDEAKTAIQFIQQLYPLQISELEIEKTF